MMHKPPTASLTLCERGTAAVEFALVMPLLIVLCFGSFELTRKLLVSLKLEKVAYTVADIVSQSTSLSAAQMNNYLTAAAEIMQPYPFSDSGRVIVTSVYQSGNTPPATIRWQYGGGGTLTSASRIGSVNGAAALPGGLTLNDRDNVLVAEVFYRYTPLFSLGLFETSDLYRSAVFKPRLGALTIPPS